MFQTAAAARGAYIYERVCRRQWELLICSYNEVVLLVTATAWVGRGRGVALLLALLLLALLAGGGVLLAALLGQLAPRDVLAFLCDDVCLVLGQSGGGRESLWFDFLFIFHSPSSKLSYTYLGACAGPPLP